MTTPPRMLILVLYGTEQLVTLPPTFDKALQLATEKFQVPSTHMVRLSCPVAEMPHYIAGYTNNRDLFIMDNDSYHYACANKHFVRLDVNIHEKIGAKNGGGVGAGGSGGGGGGGGGGGKDGGAKAEPAPTSKTAQQVLTVNTLAGKPVTMSATVSGELAKGVPTGRYLGTLSVDGGTFAQSFQGQQLGPGEVLTNFVVHEKNTARLLFRPRSIRPQIDILFPEETSLEVQFSLKGWTVTSAYPAVDLRPDGDRTRLRWFLRAKPGGVVEDLLTGSESHGLFLEMIPEAAPRPAIGVNPNAPLTPSWPDVRPTNSWCLPKAAFMVHIDRVLATLGLPAQSRSTMITSWLPGVDRHQNIAYRILNKDQMEPSSLLRLIPAPQVLMRIMEWAGRSVGHDMGVDWRETVGWTPHLNDEELFRVIEYGTLEVFNNFVV